MKFAFCLMALVLTSLPIMSLAEKPPVPDNARIVLTTDKEEYFLGENVLVHFALENIGDEPFEAEFGGDNRGSARALRFKVRALDEKHQKLSDPYPSENCFGGMGGTREVTPDTPFYQSLPIVRYARFEQPGTFSITVHHDFGWEAPPMDTYPEGVITLWFKQPTAEDAARLVKEWLAAGEYGGSTIGEKSSPHADLSQLRFGVYLEPLIEPGKNGDVQAVIGIGSIPTPEATRALIELASVVSSDDAVLRMASVEALSQLLQRLPDPYFTDETRKRTEFADAAREPRRWLAEKSWREEFAEDVRNLAAAVLRNTDSSLVAKAAYMLECIGTVDDAPQIIAALDREIEKSLSKTVDKNSFPRPARGCFELQQTVRMLLKRGWRPSETPETPGQSIAFALELNRNREFRPKGWIKTCDQLLQSSVPAVQEQVLKNLPSPMPEALRPRLALALKSQDSATTIAACQIIGHDKLEEFREPLLDLLSRAKNEWQFGAANTAAVALGVNYDRIEILVSRLNEPEMMFKSLELLKLIFSNTSGGGSSSNIDMQAEASRIRPLWQAFIETHALELKAGWTFELPHPDVSAEMFPVEYRMTLRSGQSWPERE